MFGAYLAYLSISAYFAFNNYVSSLGFGYNIYVFVYKLITSTDTEKFNKYFVTQALHAHIYLLYQVKIIKLVFFSQFYFCLWSRKDKTYH